MPLPTITLALYDRLAADATLLALLGVHRLETGATWAALAHFWPKAKLAEVSRTWDTRGGNLPQR